MKKEINRTYHGDVKKLKEFYDTDPETHVLIDALISFYLEKEEFMDLLEIIKLQKKRIHKLHIDEAKGIKIGKEKDNISDTIKMHIDELFEKYNIFNHIEIVDNYLREVDNRIEEYLTFDERNLLNFDKVLIKFLKEVDKELILTHNFTTDSLSHLLLIHKK